MAKVRAQKMPSVSARQRQQADGDVGLAEKRLELIAAVEDRDLGGLPRRAHPGGDLEAERLQHQRRRLGHHAEAQEADAPLLGPDDRHPAPFPIGLGRLVARHVAMEAQDVHDDVFRHHRIAARRLDLAERDLRQLRMLDECLHAGRAAEHGFQVREGGKLIEIRMHEGEVFDVLQLARIGPDANFQIGKLLLEGVAPCLRIADTLVQLDDE